MSNGCNKQLILFLLLSLSFLFVGCSDFIEDVEHDFSVAESIYQDKQELMDSSAGLYFEKVANDEAFNFEIYRDRLTDVLYLRDKLVCANGRGLSLCVMYDADGLPLTYERWLLLMEEPSDE